MAKKKIKQLSASEQIRIESNYANSSKYKGEKYLTLDEQIRQKKIKGIIKKKSRLTTNKLLPEKTKLVDLFLSNDNSPLTESEIYSKIGVRIRDNRKLYSNNQNTLIKRVIGEQISAGKYQKSYRLSNKFYSKNKILNSSNINFWWVNQNQTFKHEIKGGYMWSPKKNKNGNRNHSYDNMTKVNIGDFVYSFIDAKIPYIGIIESLGYSFKKPDEFGATGENWKKDGWKVDVKYYELKNIIKPKNHINELKSLLPNKYSPLRKNGDGIQNLYLAKIDTSLSNKLNQLIGNEIFNLLKEYKTHSNKKENDTKNKPIKENVNRLELKAFYPKDKNGKNNSDTLIDPNDLYQKSEAAKEKTKKANKIHEDTLEILSKYLRNLGYEMLWNGHIDAYSELKESNAIFEVKSIENDNEKSQIRGGISQLYEYRFFHNIENASLWLLLSSKPSDKWIYYIRKDRNINLLWVENGELSGNDIDKIK